MVRDLFARFGREGVAMLCGVPGMTVRQWRDGKPCNASARRAIWLAWCAVYHPERISTFWDWVTWGRFANSRRVKRALKAASRETATEDWSI